MQWKTRGIPILFLFVLLCIPEFALAETCAGSVVSLDRTIVYANCAGVLENFSCVLGERIETGEMLGSIQTKAIYAEGDGTVASVNANTDSEQTALEIIPKSLYTIYCSIDGAYQSVETSCVHSGETVYISCTVDGSHRGIGRITTIDDSEYRVEVLGGSFYVGEAVYLYRDSNYSSKSKIGIGTLVASDIENYSCSGSITEMYVEAGDTVERGQILFRYLESETNANPSITAPISGILDSVSVTAGTRLEAGDPICSIVPDTDLRIEIALSQESLAEIECGDAVEIVYTADPNESVYRGVIEQINRIADESGNYEVYILPDVSQSLRIGQTAVISY